MPVKQISPSVAGKDNVWMMNKVRKFASTDYRSRIDEVTDANIQETVRRLMDYAPARNEFADVLINKVGLSICRNQLWENPFAEFKLGLMQFGESIEEIQVGLVKSKTYEGKRDSLEKDIFGRKQIDVDASYHVLNRKVHYDITIDEPQLAQAFTSPEGLSNFVAMQMTAQTTSANWDEFTLMTSLFRTYYEADGFFKINIPDVKADGSDEADAKVALRKIIEIAETLPFISTAYNAAGMPLAVKPEDLILFTTPAFKAAIGVEALAAAFNIAYTDIPTRMITIPEANFNIPGAQAILTTKDFFVVADTRFDMTSAPNPVGLYQNYFLHIWQIISASRFVPAILLTSTEPSTVIPEIETPVVGVSAITVYDATGDVTRVKRGETYGIAGAAITDPSGGLNDNIRLTLTGAKSERSYISNNGLVHIAVDDASQSVSVTATATDDNAFTKKLVLPVYGDRVVLWPNPRVETDVDNDGLLEVTPEAPTLKGTKITVPATEGAIYKNGATEVTGSVITVSAATTIIATAAAGWELKTGATATWTLTPA